MPAVSRLARGVAALALACHAAAQGTASPPIGLDELEAKLTAERLALRHGELIVEYERIVDRSAAADVDERAAARIAALGLELGLLRRAGSLDELRALPPAKLAERLAAAAASGEDHVTAARLGFLLGATAIAEDALERARAADPELKGPTDELIAEIRTENVPRGGYDRYRGRWLAIEVRDRARAVDAALETLAATGDREATPPLAPVAGESRLDAFEALGAEGPAALRERAAALRELLAADYAEPRTWLRSYADPGARAAILAELAELEPIRKDALELIRRYDKPQQAEVDAFRTRLETLYGDHRETVAQDRQQLERVEPGAAFALLTRIRAREAALTAIDAFLAGWAKPGLGAAPLTPPPGADVGRDRRLPGRAQSGLEDVLWLLVHFRAGQLHDAVTRADELARKREELTTWERWLLDELQADAVDAFNAVLAHSLDATELQFATRLNEYRRVLGLRPFELEERLNVASRKHSQEMVDLGYFGHVSPVPRNKTPTDRARLEGYSGGVGENCLAGRVDGIGAFEGWYHSPGHHRNLVSGGIHLGVGAANEHGMWTMVAGGADLTWRSLHGDLPPAARAAHERAADEFFEAELDTRRRADARRAAARQAIDAAGAAALPALARRAFPAALDPRDDRHRAAPAALRWIVERELPTAWQPLQIAAVATAIEMLRLGNSLPIRRDAAELVATRLGDLLGYSPEAGEPRRAEAVTELRKAWEDDGQWRFRRMAGPPAPQTLPGRRAVPGPKAPKVALGKAERMRLAKRHGGGRDTEQAVDRALAFLAKVQDEDGAWRAQSWLARSPKFDRATAGLGNAEWDVPMTGLCLLAFATAGHTTASGDYRGEVRRGLEFLSSRMLDYGRFETVATHYMYGHALATAALCEHAAYSADPAIVAAAQLAVDFLVYAQHVPTGGWRYEANQAADTSVTGWVVLALNSAYKADLDVAGFRNALRFISSVTEPGYYQVGYTGRPGIATENLRLTSVGMVCRLFLGEPARSGKVVLPAWRLLKRLPDPRRVDFYYWYYASLALFQVGGEHWQTWNAALKPTLLELQDDDPDSPYRGSWPPRGEYANTGGRVLQTGLAVLMLTTYYRYDRAPKLRIHPFTGDLRAEIEPFLAVLRDSRDDPERRVAFATMIEKFGPSLVGTVLRLLTDDGEEIELKRTMARALPLIAAPQHEGALLAALDHPDGAIAEQVLRALADVSSDDSVPALIARLGHGSRNVRAYCATALGRLGAAEAAKPIADRLAVEKDNWCRGQLQRALRSLQTKSRLLPLVDAALGRATGKLAILEALELLDPSGLAERLADLREADAKLWNRAVAAVREHREGAPVALLILLLEHDDAQVRTDAVKLLRALAGKGFEFEPEGEKGDRLEAVARWREWWGEVARGYGG